MILFYSTHSIQNITVSTHSQRKTFFTRCFTTFFCPKSWESDACLYGHPVSFPTSAMSSALTVTCGQWPGSWTAQSRPSLGSTGYAALAFSAPSQSHMVLGTAFCVLQSFYFVVSDIFASPRTVVWSSMMKTATAVTRWRTICSVTPAMSRGWTRAPRRQRFTSTTSSQSLLQTS